MFGFLQRASEPEELTEFIEENTKEFSSLTEDAYDMIASMSKTGELKELKKDVEQTEDYDMCKAIDMMVADGEKRGEARGIKLGEERGEARGIETGRNIFRLYKKGYKQNEIAESLKISLERVKEFLENNSKILAWNAGGKINISAAAGSCFTLCHFMPVFRAVYFYIPP